MTAVATASGTGVRLICDGCGKVADTTGCGLYDAEVVYVAVAEIGWAGSLFARGQHRCPDCEPRSLQGRGYLPGRGYEPRSGSETPASGRASRHLTRSAGLVRVVGDVDIDGVGELRTALDAALERHCQVIVDLTGAASLDSITVSAIVRTRRSARRRGGDLVLAAPSPFLRTVLQTIRQDTAFRIFDTVPQAMSAMRAAFAEVVHGRGRLEPDD
jgi:anti-anti-sigma factor